MIFSPLAFFSYTVPQMQEWEMVGWKKWWPDTIKLAFMAPVFVFFMYLIIKFLDTKLGLAITDQKDGMDFLLGIFIPFIFIMVLLMKARSIATDLSGKMGQSITNGLATVGGVALGAGIGGLAVAGRATIGRAGSAIANSDWAKKAESKGVFGARTLRTISSGVGKGSMDIRGIKIAGKGIEDATGLTNTGRAKEGGFEKVRAEKTIARTQRANELKVGEDSKLKQTLNKTETDLHDLLNKNKSVLEGLDKSIETKRQALNDANAQFGGGSEESKKAGVELKNAVNRKKALREGTNYEGDFVVRKVEKEREIDTGVVDSQGNKIKRKEKYVEEVEERDDSTKTDYTKANMGGTGEYKKDEKGNDVEIMRTMDYIERTEVKNAKHAIENENIKRGHDYAEYIASNSNKVANFITSGGQHSSAGADEAAHKIRMDIKLSGGDKSHKSEAHAPAKTVVHTEPKAETKSDTGHGEGHH